MKRHANSTIQWLASFVAIDFGFWAISILGNCAISSDNCRYALTFCSMIFYAPYAMLVSPFINLASSNTVRETAAITIVGIFGHAVLGIIAGYIRRKKNDSWVISGLTALVVVPSVVIAYFIFVMMVAR
jgi:hypothetical protein